MVDHSAHRLWADNHEAFSREAGGLLAQIGIALKALNRHQFDAPWKNDAANDSAPAARCA